MRTKKTIPVTVAVLAGLVGSSVIMPSAMAEESTTPNATSTETQPSPAESSEATSTTSATDENGSEKNEKSVQEQKLAAEAMQNMKTIYEGVDGWKIQDFDDSAMKEAQGAFNAWKKNGKVGSNKPMVVIPSLYKGKSLTQDKMDELAAPLVIAVANKLAYQKAFGDVDKERVKTKGGLEANGKTYRMSRNGAGQQLSKNDDGNESARYKAKLTYGDGTGAENANTARAVQTIWGHDTHNNKGVGAGMTSKYVIFKDAKQGDKKLETEKSVDVKKYIPAAAELVALWSVGITDQEEYSKGIEGLDTSKKDEGTSSETSSTSESETATTDAPESEEATTSETTTASAPSTQSANTSAGGDSSQDSSSDATSDSTADGKSDDGKASESTGSTTDTGDAGQGGNTPAPDITPHQPQNADDETTAKFSKSGMTDAERDALAQSGKGSAEDQGLKPQAIDQGGYYIFDEAETLGGDWNVRQQANTTSDTVGAMTPGSVYLVTDFVKGDEIVNDAKDAKWLRVEFLPTGKDKTESGFVRTDILDVSSKYDSTSANKAQKIEAKGLKGVRDEVRKYYGMVDDFGDTITGLFKKSSKEFADRYAKERTHELDVKPSATAKPVQKPAQAPTTKQTESNLVMK